MNFNIDFNIIAGWNIPSILQSDIMVAWVKALLRPLINIHSRFIAFVAAKKYELLITGQVCRLETLLNDHYDFSLRRIYIDDAIEEEALYLYQDEENHPINLYQDSEGDPQWLYTDAESGGDLSDDFIVMVPSDIIFNTANMRSLLKPFKLPGMRYTIQTF